MVRGARQEEAGGGGLGGARWPQYAPAVTLSIQPGMLRVIGEQKPPCCGEKAMRWERTVREQSGTVQHGQRVGGHTPAARRR